MQPVVPPSSLLPVSTRTVIEADGEQRRRTLHVFCPMQERVVAIDGCVDCSMCSGFESHPAPSGRPVVRCSYPARETPARSLPVGSVLSRFTVCVRVDAIRAALPVGPGSPPMPVVDEHVRLVGLLEAGSRVRVDAGARALAIQEHVTLSAALAQLAHGRRRSAPVVASDGTVVGALDDLDALRALRRVRAT